MARKSREYNKAFRHKSPARTLQDIRELSDAELTKLHKHMEKRVNTNLTRMQQQGLSHTPAARGLERKMSRGDVSRVGELAKGRRSEREQLVHDVYEYNRYLTSKTHTATTARAWDRDVNNRLGNTYASAGEDTKKKFWEMYDVWRSQIGASHLPSDELQRQMWDYWEQGKYKYHTSKREDEMGEIVASFMDVQGFFD